MAEKSAFESGEQSDDPNNVMISLESTAEWRIHNILFDGTERYLQPLSFPDHVAKLAHKVDWKKIIGDENFNADDYSDDEENESAENRAKLEAEEAGKRGTDSDARGPWENVAKNLHQSLIEMNVLLDVIQIAHDGKYMVFDSIDSLGNETFGEPNKLQLGMLFTFKKKVMLQGQKLFENIVDRLTKLKHTTNQTKEPDFQAELIELRQAWRLKKLGNAILGDLSYRNYGAKFKPNCTFEIRKSAKFDQLGPSGSQQAQNLGLSAIEIVLPKDLEQTACLKICIEHESNRNGPSEFGFFNRSSKSSMVPPLPAEMLYPGFSTSKAYLRSGLKIWQQKLEMAQRTLLCRDLFAQLSKEAVHLNDVCCIVRGDCITVNLSDGFILKIMLITDQENYQHDKTSHFLTSANDEKQDSGPNFGNFVLEHSLYQMFCDDLEIVSAPLIARPVAGPVTLGPKRLRTAGPEALPLSALTLERQSDKLLLLRLIERANHYTLLIRCRESLRNFAHENRDPLVSIHWSPESTGVWSLAKISMTTPFYESCNRTHACVEVGIDSLTVTLKDGEELKFGTNVQDLIDYFQILAKQHMVTAFGVLARHINWNSLYCSLTSVNRHGRITPTILIGNTWGNRSICVKCPPDSTPEIYVQNSMKKREDFLSDCLDDNLWTNMRGDYRLVDYSALIGRCFLQKIELLVSALS